MMNPNSFCQYCGTALEPGLRFCKNCGGQIAAPEAEINSPSTEAAPTVFHPPVRVSPSPVPAVKPAYPTAQPAASATQGKRNFIWLLPVGIGCLGLVCICLFSVVGYFFLSRPATLSETASPTPVAEILPAATEAPLPTETSLPEPTDLPAPTEAPPPTEAPEPTPWPTEAELGLTGNQYMDESSIFDDFSSNALGWAEYDDGLTILQYENEAYSFQVTEPDYYDWVYAPVDFWPNAIQFDVWGFPGTQNGTFGIFCQYQDEDNYYYVEIDLETNEFLLGQNLAGEMIPLTIPDENGQYWLPADPLKSFPDEVNRIDLSCYQDFMVLVINDSLVYHATVTDPFLNPGEMALFVYTFSFAGPDGYKIFFDNVGIQQIEE